MGWPPWHVLPRLPLPWLPPLQPRHPRPARDERSHGVRGRVEVGKRIGIRVVSFRIRSSIWTRSRPCLGHHRRGQGWVEEELGLARPGHASRSQSPRESSALPVGIHKSETSAWAHGSGHNGGDSERNDVGAFRILASSELDSSSGPTEWRQSKFGAGRSALT